MKRLLGTTINTYQATTNFMQPKNFAVHKKGTIGNYTTRSWDVCWKNK